MPPRATSDDFHDNSHEHNTFQVARPPYVVGNPVPTLCQRCTASSSRFSTIPYSDLHRGFSSLIFPYLPGEYATALKIIRGVGSVTGNFLRGSWAPGFSIRDEPLRGGLEVNIIFHYRTLKGESEPKAQCISEVISHLQGFERQAKVP